MVAEVASVENCYVVWYVAFSTMLSERKNKRSVGTLASIFLTWDAGLNWRGASVFRGEGGFAVDDGDRHGGVHGYRNFYMNRRRLEYRVGRLPVS